MPGTTPLRGYPYPTDTDPIDVAGDMQALAEAIDTDVGDIRSDVDLAVPSWANFPPNGSPMLISGGNNRIAFAKHSGSADIIANVDGDIRFEKAGRFHVVVSLTVQLGPIAAELPYMTMLLRKFNSLGAMNFERLFVGGGTYWTQISGSAVFDALYQEKLQISLAPNTAGSASVQCRGDYSFVSVSQVS